MFLEAAILLYLFLKFFGPISQGETELCLLPWFLCFVGQNEDIRRRKILAYYAVVFQSGGCFFNALIKPIMLYGSCAMVYCVRRERQPRIQAAKVSNSSNLGCGYR